MSPKRLTTLTVALAVALPAAAQASPFPAPTGPLIMGHRGTAGHLPEHTLASYRTAIRLGADYVEPDLVSTKDGHLVSRHEPNITNTTDVAKHPEFADRKRTAIVDGEAQTGWFASDFTLKELRTLRAVQPAADRPQQFNGRYRIPTFEEVVELAKRQSIKQRRQIGIIPEVKHSTYHQALGLPIERRLVAILRKEKLNSAKAPVWIQSFETANLRLLNRLTPVHLVQLIDANDVNPDGSLDFTAPFDRPYDWTASGDPELLSRTFAYLTTDAGLAEVATYADGIGPWKPYIVPTALQGAQRVTLPPTDLVARAHAHGLQVIPFTFRNEQRYLAADYGGQPVNEYLQFFDLGVDGLFSDFPETAFAARELFRLQAGDPEVDPG